MVDETQVTHDNNGRFYRIKMDIAKEGSSVWNLTPYVKGRVGDNRFGLQVKWTYQGRTMDVSGMKPYIAGNVGHYGFDEQKDLRLADDASVVHYVGSPDDCQDAGNVTYYFPEQMFPKDGIFKGYLGLLDDRDSSSQPHISGVTIWFKVLPGIAQMGHACDFYISDLEKAIQNAQEDIRQNKLKFDSVLKDALQNLKDKYDQEVAEHANALTEDTSNLRKLAQTCGSIQAQIEANDIVKVSDFNRITENTRSLIDNRLKHISLNPEAFSSLDALNAKYPAGSDGLFRIGDQGYIWENGAWTNIGKLASTVISDSDFNQRLASFMFFAGKNDHIDITETYSQDLNAQKGTLKVPSGVLVYVGDKGLFNSIDTLELNYSYSQNQVDKDGLLTLYFDNNSELYFAFEPKTRTDAKILSVYQGKIFGALNTDRIFVNGIDKGGWGNSSRPGYAMLLPMFPNNDNHIDVEYENWKYKVTYASINFIGLDGSHNYINQGRTIEGKGDIYTPLNLYVSPEDKNCYLDVQGHRSTDLLIATLYGSYVYGLNTQAFTVNGIKNGGWGPDSIPGYVMSLPMYDNQDINVHYRGNWEYTVTYPKLNIIGSDGCHYVTDSGTIQGKGDSSTTLNLYASSDKELYLDTRSHTSDDLFIATLYGPYVYGTNVDAFVVDGIDHGGFGKIKDPYDLTDWRTDAYAGKEVNIAWLGDSTFEGYKVKNPENVAANYINKLLINDFPKVRSYNCSQSGWTTWGLSDDFENLTKEVPNMKLVIIGGGINDGGDVVHSRQALDKIVKKVQKIKAVPVICTTQASALLYADKDDGGDWNLEQDWYAKINEMRRIYARENNIMLIDLEKFDTNFIEYGPYKLSDMFDDQMHGHDPIHIFEAQLVMSLLAKDHVDIIKHDKPISVTTMKARSDSSYNLTSQELIDDKLNELGFKAHLTRSNASEGLTIIDYQFFIPASQQPSYLNGYNLGDTLQVELNGDLMDLTGTQQLKILEPGYYHVIVKAKTTSFDFVGLRIEQTNLNAANPIEEIKARLTSLEHGATQK